MSYRNVVLSLGLLLVLAPSAMALEGYRYSRRIAVAEPGWVGIHLHGNALAHATTDLQLFAPTGEEAPFRLLAPGDNRRPVRVLAVTERPEGWTLVMDLGRRAPRHARLWFEFAQKVRAPGCRLEGSDDRQTWSPLVVADLFRLGEARDFQQMVLDYPPSEHRYLRLTWPLAAGLPELRRVEVATLDGHARWQTIPEWRCEGYGPRAVVCRVPIPRPATALRRLDLEWTSSGRTGYRVAIGEAGRFQPQRQGLLQAGATSARLPLELESAAAETLRLELYAGGETAPELTGVAVLVASRTLLFEAREAGTYVLAYGRPTPLPATEEVETGEVSAPRLAWLEPEAEAIGPWPEIPATLAAPAVAMPAAEFARSWELDDEGLAPGTVVRLELTGEVYAAARSDLGDLRLEVAGRQLPFVRWSPPEPKRLWRRAGAESEPLDGGRTSRIELEIATELPSTELWLTAPVAPFVRSVHGRYRRPSQPGLSEQWYQAFGPIRWRCADALPLPCRATAALGSVPQPTFDPPSIPPYDKGGRPHPSQPQLRIEVDNGDNPPLPSLDLELWRRRDVLLFVWPEAGPVTLRAGAEGLRAPRYDLAALGDLLLLRDWEMIVLGAGAEEPAPPGDWVRWALTGSIVVAAGVLLLLLARLLRSQESSPGGEE